MDEKLRILLCEDDENLGMLLREYLQAKGYSAELYPDGDAGFGGHGTCFRSVPLELTRSIKNHHDDPSHACKYGKQ